MPVRLMRPATRRATEQPRWEVIDDAGTVIGWIQQKRLGGRGGRAMFEAIGWYVPTRSQVSMEVSPDFDERVAQVVAFAADPLSAERVLSWQIPYAELARLRRERDEQESSRPPSPENEVGR